MASPRNTGSKGRGKSVSLAEEDRRYLSESLGDARGRGAASGSESEGGLFEALERFKRLRGAIDDMDVRESVDKAQEYLSEQIENARDYARENPGKMIGGAAGVLVGASLLALALRRASGEEKRRSRSTSSGASTTASVSANRKSAGGSKRSRKSSKKSSKRR